MRSVIISLYKYSYLLFILLISVACKQKSDVITPGALWNDDNGVHINAHGGGILKHSDTYYWYGEHKIAGKAGNVAEVGVHCYSSEDLVNWKDEGIALEVVEVAGHDIEKGCILERPKVIYNAKNNNFVMWFHLEIKRFGYKAARSAVAVSDSPTGPFVFKKSFRPNAGFWPQNVKKLHYQPVPEDLISKQYCGSPGCLPAHTDSLNLLGRDFEGGQMARDMNLFVDDDGKAYHIYSSEENSTLHISLLSDDYQSYSGTYYRFFPNRYFEAPAIFKRQGMYYIIASGCTGWDPNEARSARAPSIFGPWEELGNPCKDVNNEAPIGEELTFGAQSTYVLQVQGETDSYIAMFDIWRPDDAIDGRYIWLPIEFVDDVPVINWRNNWSIEEVLD